VFEPKHALSSLEYQHGVATCLGIVRYAWYESLAGAGLLSEWIGEGWDSSPFFTTVVGKKQTKDLACFWIVCREFVQMNFGVKKRRCNERPGPG